jgi:hypothetical protein
MGGATWTPRDLDIVETLAAKVRLLTPAQVARGWWPPGGHGEGHARRRLRLLARAGLLCSYRVNVHPVQQPDAPAIRWKPGEPGPDVEAVSSKLQARWTEPARPTTVYTASPGAASLFGCSGGDLPELTHRDHDLLLGEIFIAYLRNEPAAARRWVGESARPKAGYRMKDPDAFLLDEAGSTLRVIESGGKYGPDRVEAFHEHCAEYRLPYELW